MELMPIVIKWVLVISITYVLPSEPEGDWTYQRMEKKLETIEECIKRGEEEMPIIKAWSHHRVMNIRKVDYKCFWYEADR
jgi:hypothetical protein